jgi:hypothetical protein
MNPLLSTLMPEATTSEALYLYAVYNFDSVQEPDASRVPEARMRGRASAVVKLLEESPPRLIVPMETRSYALLRETLAVRGYAVDDQSHPIKISIYGNPRRSHSSLSGYRIDGVGPLGGSVVVRLPQHPARIFRADYARACGRAVRGLFERLHRN